MKQRMASCLQEISKMTSKVVDRVGTLVLELACEENRFFRLAFSTGAPMKIGQPLSFPPHNFLPSGFCSPHCASVLLVRLPKFIF